jgi:hypothetical protein
MFPLAQMTESEENESVGSHHLRYMSLCTWPYNYKLYLLKMQMLFSLLRK